MWKIQAKIIFIVPLENDKKNHRHYHHHYFLRQRNSRTIVRSPYYRAKRDGRSRWMEGGRGGQYRLDRCNFHVENRPACCNCSFDRWPRRESSKEGGGYDRRIDKNPSCPSSTIYLALLNLLPRYSIGK